MASRLSPSCGTCLWILREDVNTWVSVMVVLQLLMSEQKYWQLWLLETCLWSHVLVCLIWHLVISSCFGLPWNYRHWQSVPAVAEIEILDPLHKMGGERQTAKTSNKDKLVFYCYSLQKLLDTCTFVLHTGDVRCYLFYLLWQACKETDCQLVMFTFSGWCAGVPVWTCYI